MKYKKIFIAVLLLVSFVFVSEAQIIVTSTNAKSKIIKVTSDRKKGLAIRPELGVGVVDYFNNVRYFPDLSVTSNLLCGLIYQFNPYISMGVVTGVNYTTFGNLTTIPIFANIRGYFCNRKWSPYYDIKLGYNFTPNSYSARYNDAHKYGSSYGHVLKYYKLTGFYSSFGLGLQYKNFDFGLEVHLVTEQYILESYPWRDFAADMLSIDRYKKITLGTLGLKVAYNFQLKKKK